MDPWIAVTARSQKPEAAMVILIPVFRVVVKNSVFF
jgi:hypothetical protein